MYIVIMCNVNNVPLQTYVNVTIQSVLLYSIPFANTCSKQYKSFILKENISVFLFIILFFFGVPSLFSALLS